MYYCAQDIVEYLMNSVGGGSQDSEHRVLRAAAHHGYRDVVNIRDWNWHVSSGDLTDDTVGSGDGVKTFTLPVGVRNIDALIPPRTSAAPAVYVSPEEWERLNVTLPTISLPLYWTAMRDPSAPDRWQVKIVGNPVGVTYRFTYRRRPAPLKYMGFEDACKDVASPPSGVVKRYGTALHYPEGASGIYPFTAEEIVGVADSLTGSPAAGAKTLISDHLDVSETMFTAVLSCAEMWLAKMLGKNVEGAMSVYQRDLRLALEADVISPVSGRRSSWPYIGTARVLGYYSPSGPDAGA
jgi:hypothetical protein